MAGIDSYTKLLLHCNGLDAATSIIDSATGKTVTPVGTAQLDTAQKKFGSAALLLDGNSDRLNLADNADWDLFANQADICTIDFFIKFASAPAANTEIDFVMHKHPSVDTRWFVGYYNNLFFCFVNNGSVTFNPGSTGVISDTNWHHVAFVKNGTTFKIFLDGVQVYSGTSSVTLATDGSLAIGGSVNNNNWVNGWIDEFRISKGIARWTENFTPPTYEYGRYSPAMFF